MQRSCVMVLGNKAVSALAQQSLLASCLLGSIAKERFKRCCYICFVETDRKASLLLRAYLEGSTKIVEKKQKLSSGS